MSVTQEHIININTENATKQTKSLKQEIKELKDLLYTLEEGTDEYNDTMQKLANKMFIVKETQEQATLAMADWGQYLSNSLRAMSGAVGALQAYTSVMSLLGVEIDDNNVLTQKLVQSMALLQGVSAIENSIDAFKNLAKSIKNAGGAVGVLRKALNTLKSHPVIAALSVLTVAGSALYSYTKGKEEERENEFAEHQQQRAKTFVSKNINFEDTKEYLELLKIEANEYTILSKKLKYYEKQLEEFNKNKSLYLDANTQEIIEGEQTRLQLLIKQTEKEKEIQAIKDTNTRKAEATAEQERILSEKIAERLAEEEEWQNSLASIYDKNRAIAESSYLYGDIDEVEYKEKLLKINEEELNNLISIYNQQGRNYKQTKEYGDKRLQQIKDEIELENLRLAKEKERLENEFESKQNNLDLSNQKTSLGLETEYLSKLNDVDLTQNIAEQVISIEQWKQEELYRIQKEGIEKQLSLLQEKKDKGLISEYEFASEFVRLSAEQTELEKQQVQKRIELKENEVEANEAIQDLIKQNQIELTQSVGSILGGLADSLGEQAESYKHLKAGEAIIDTLSASVAVFAGISKDTKGWGLALAIAKATAVLLTGMNSVRQIYAVNLKSKNNSNYSFSNGATASINKNYSNVRLNDGRGAEVNIGTEVANSLNTIRVVVSANEITDKQNMIKRVQVSNEF